MSWFKRDSASSSVSSSHYNNYSGGGVTTKTPSPEDEHVRLEAFRVHWRQAHNVLLKEGEVTVGEVQEVLANMDAMLTLLLQETKARIAAQGSQVSGPLAVDIMGPLLFLLLSEGVLEQLLSWSLRLSPSTLWKPLLMEQLKIYEVLVSHSPQNLFHEPVVRPLLQLLRRVEVGRCAEADKWLVVLLNTLCVCLAQLPDLLQVFFDPQASQPELRFLIFSLLVPMVHREGPVGQQARDAVLLCLALSREHEDVGQHIAADTDLCPMLTAGLGGLYFQLPRTLPSSTSSCPELANFLTFLEFCSAAAQVAHPAVKQQLEQMMEQNFLESVLAPLLAMSEDPAAPTTYLRLSLLSAGEGLRRPLINFLLRGRHEGKPLLNFLVPRLGAPGAVGLATLSLFHCLLDMDHEELMVQLVFRYLRSGSHIMVSQRGRVGEVDMYGSTAEKLLSFVPECCVNRSKLYYSGRPTFRGGSLRVRGGTGAVVPVIMQPCLLDYLRSARKAVLSCTRACQSWTGSYDSLDGVAPVMTTPTRTSVPEEGDEEFWNLLDSASTPSSLSELDDELEAYDVPGCLSADSGCCEVSPAIPATATTQPPPDPDTGPFLSTLLARLEMLPANGLLFNLQLTGLLARLATYPQPLLRSFLLNHMLVFQPTVRSLIQVLGSLKLKMDGLSQSIDNFQELLWQAQQFLEKRAGGGKGGLRRSSSAEVMPQRRRSFLASMLQLKRPEPTLLESDGRGGYRYLPANGCDDDREEEESSNSDWRVALCAVVLAEFLHELAAISLEHGVVQLEPSFNLLLPSI